MFLHSVILVSFTSGFLSGLMFSIVSQVPNPFAKEHDEEFNFPIFARSLAFSSIFTAILFVLIAFSISSLGLVPESQLNGFMISQGVLLVLVGIITRVGIYVVSETKMFRRKDSGEAE
jgi:hypothetical protein